MKRIILKCRSLEAKLEQSVPKKTYQDAVQTMQASIDNLSENLTRTKDELARTESLGGRINSLSAQLASLASQVSANNEAVKALTEKYSVPKEVHSKTTSRIEELETALRSSTSNSVPRSEYADLQSQIHELEKKLADSVPREQYSRLVDEISGLVSIRRERLALENELMQEIVSTGKQGEISEIQSNLSEIKGAEDSGSSPSLVDIPGPSAVGENANSDGQERVHFDSQFYSGIQKMSLEEFESWTKNLPSEAFSQDSIFGSNLKRILDSGITGEELRQKILEAVAQSSSATEIVQSVV